MSIDRVDQNKKKVEERFQQFKNKLLSSRQILSPAKQNSAVQDDLNFMKLFEDCSDKLFSFMLEDPAMYEASQNFRREAEQKNKQKMMALIPQRYKILLGKQAQLKTLQKVYQQRFESQNQHIGQLKDQINCLQNNLSNQQQQMVAIARDANKRKSQLQSELCSIIKQKQNEVLNLKSELEILGRKFEKVNNDYKNGSKIISQLRENQSIFEAEMSKLVTKVKESEEKLIKAHKRILQNENEKKKAIEVCMSENQKKMNDLICENQRIREQLRLAVERLEFKQSLIQLSEEERQNLISNFQREQSRRFEEIQKVREGYLESIKQFDALQRKLAEKEGELSQIVKIANLQKQQMKKELDKHLSIQCALKTEANSLTVEIERLRQQNEELSHSSSRVKQLQKQVKQLQKIRMDESEREGKLKQYQSKLECQEKVLWELKERAVQWIKEPTSDSSNGELHRKILEYERIINKLRDEIVGQTSRLTVSADKQRKLFKSLLEENKNLKKQFLKI